MTKTLKNKQLTKDQKITELLGKYTAPTAFYEYIAFQVEDAMQEVQAGKVYTLKMLCGEEFWQILETAFNRRLAGRCFAHMVDQGRFPFEFFQYKRSPTKRYLLK